MDGGLGLVGKWQLTSRDQRWLEWVGKFGFVSTGQVRRWLVLMDGQAHERSVLRRVQAARELGLVETRRVLADQSSLVWLTREGMRLLGTGGEVTAPRLSQVHHDLHVVDLALWLLETKPSWELVTERKLRREDTPVSGKTSIPVWAVYRRDAEGRAVAGGARMYPDLVSVRRDGRHLVHEVEVSPKDVRRLVRLMSSYTHAEAVAGARYYCFPKVLDRVRRAADTVNERSKISGDSF